MIDLKNLDKWIAWPEGRSVCLPRKQPRRVRLQVNAPEFTRIDLVYQEETVFLANVQGYQVIQFIAPGAVELVCDTPGVRFYTSEFEETSFEVPNAVIFTKIAERRARNPELEYMMQAMSKNLERRLQQQQQELVQQFQAAQARQVQQPTEVIPIVDPKASVGSSNPSEPEPVANPGQPTDSPGEAGTATAPG